MSVRTLPTPGIERGRVEGVGVVEFDATGDVEFETADELIVVCDEGEVDHPVFVLTHHPREPLELEGGTTFTFVTEGFRTALEQARRAAGGKDVSLAGGGNAARQYLIAGLVDETEINLVPTLLGSGERLFDGVSGDLRGFELVRTVAAPMVTHLKFARR